ncbi:hypothetical protein RHO12_03020 [Orbus sturtevantii]|uniref:hypothetical protein n=1 Tax=Orbus sturtevantii TaxID=3074109 RepID=UPI00370D6CF5
MNTLSKYNRKYYQGFMWIVLLLCCIMPIKFAFALDAECAEVKIVIEQKLSFERQAFDAHMVINNGLAGSVLKDIRVQLLFTDKDNRAVIATQDANNDGATFFYYVKSLSGINDINGSGQINTKTNAEIHWLIIPSFGAAEFDNTLYYIGAKVTYNLNGQETTVEVIPDYVVVKPQPLLTLDYFMPKDVYGDDPFTPEIEPAIPFTLGVRVKNDGRGTSYKTTIDSAQPKIVENKQNLLVDFTILDGYIDDQAVGKSLLLDFGDIEGNTAKVGRWNMVTSLSGKFVDFKATFTHADTLGGSVTSLLKAVNSHTLIHDVKVDLPDRDHITDFLALDGDVIRVYESEGQNTEVSDQSPNAVLTKVGKETNLTFPTVQGLVYIKIPDPNAGKQALNNVKRSDGKVLPTENIWLSKTRNDDLSWSYFINLFDTDTTGSYKLYESEVKEDKPVINEYSVVKGARYSLSELLPEDYYFEANKSYIVNFIGNAVATYSCSGVLNFDQQIKSCKVGLSKDYSFDRNIFMPSRSGVLHDDNTFTGNIYVSANQTKVIKVVVVPVDMDNSLTNTVSVTKGVKYSLHDLLPKKYNFEAGKSYLIKLSGDPVASYYCPGETNLDQKTKLCKTGLTRNYSFDSEIFVPSTSGILDNGSLFIGNIYMSAYYDGIIKVIVIPL